MRPALGPLVGADLYDAVTITCTNGATISATGVGACPDKGFKVVGNWLFGTAGMLSYSGLAGSDNVQLEEGATKERDVACAASGPRMPGPVQRIWSEPWLPCSFSAFKGAVRFIDGVGARRPCTVASNARRRACIAVYGTESVLQAGEPAVLLLQIVTCFGCSRRAVQRS